MLTAIHVYKLTSHPQHIPAEMCMHPHEGHPQENIEACVSRQSNMHVEAEGSQVGGQIST